MSKEIINRDIEVLTEREHILLRPEMYVGSTHITSEKTHIYNTETKSIEWRAVEYSPAFMRLFNEIFDNAYDEVVRNIREHSDFKGIINVSINTKDNSVTISDNGKGFKDADSIMKKSGKTVVETAMSTFRSGSNFRGGRADGSIGKNGIGAGAVNALSDYFHIVTKNANIRYEQYWEDFVKSEPKIDNIENSETGTTVTFIPYKKIFKKEKWNFDLIYTTLIIKNFIFKNTDTLSNTTLNFFWDGEKVDIDKDIIPEGYYELKLNNRMKLFIWSERNGKPFSFVNTSFCTGFHLDLIKEFIDDKIFNRASINGSFYNIMVILNLKPKDAKFKEQVKAVFDINRQTFNEILPLKITRTDLQAFQNSNVFVDIINDIEESNKLSLIKNINTKAKKKNKQIKISDNFFSSKKNDVLYIVEGLSAVGSINIAKDPVTESSYALRGKIKNVQTLDDLESKVIVDLINIMGLKLEDEGKTCKYNKIYISTDFDEDGHSICALLLHFFSKFFPKLIEDGRVYRLIIPLIAYEHNKKIVFKYTMEDLKTIPSDAKNISYLKGLGSIPKEYWKLIMKNKTLEQYKMDKNTIKMLDVCFNKDEILRRKKWLLS